jgi:hypothetical protein
LSRNGGRAGNRGRTRAELEHESDCHRRDYGDAGDLQLRDLPDPRAGDEAILVRVRAAGVNPLHWKIRQGQLRLFVRLRFSYVLGSDIAGEVVSVGVRANKFKATRSSRSAIQGEAQADREREIGPDGVGDDLRREAMALCSGATGSWRRHGAHRALPTG